MTLFRGICRSAVLLFAALILLGWAPVKAFAIEYDSLVAQLKKDDWQTHFSSSAEREELNRSYEALLALTENKGIHWRIRIRGIVLLSYTSNPERAVTLIRMYHNPFFNAGCPSIKSSIITALGNIDNDQKVVDTVIEGTNDSEIIVRETAIRALGKLGDGRAVPSLIGKLNDSSFAIRLAAIRSLAEIKDQRAVPHLQNIVHTDHECLLKNEALSAIDKIRS